MPNMPTLADMSNLGNYDVYKWLTEIPSSMYHGLSVEELCQLIHINVARRYFAELILLNAQDKSRLAFVKEARSN